MLTPIVLRQQSYNNYETLTNEGTTLDESQVDTNWIGLLERIYDVIPTGAVIPYYGTITIPSGWLLTNGSTIGNTSSSADSSNVLYERLFTLLWNECVANPTTALSAHDASSNPINFASSPVSAATAWAGLYIIALPDLRNSFPVGLSPANIAVTLNKKGGAETVDASHIHTNNIVLSTVAAHNHGTVSGTTSSAGGFTPTGTITMNNIPDHTHVFTGIPNSDSLTVPTITLTPTEGITEVVIPTILSQSTALGSISPAGAVTPTGTFTGTAVSAHTHTFSGTMSDAGAHTHTISSGGVQTGGNASLSIVPPFYGINFIIKYSWGL